MQESVGELLKQDISSIVANEGAKLSFQGKTVFEPVVFCGNEFVFEGDTAIDGEIANQSGDFYLTAKVSGEFSISCARCGKPLHESFSFELNEKLIKEGSKSTDEDAVVFEGNVIDIADLAVNAFLMDAPGKYLCKDDCKGLCPICGIDRNEETCSCEDESTDPRLDILNNIKF